MTTQEHKEPAGVRAEGRVQGREAFLANISGRLGRKEPLREAPKRPIRGVPDFYREIRRTEDEMIELFTAHWTALTGKVLVTDESKAKGEVARFILDALREHHGERISRWEHDGLISLGLDQSLECEGITVVPWVPRESEAHTGELLADRPEIASEDSAAGDSKWAARTQLLRETEQCNAGIVWADQAIANTGTLVLTCSPDRGRSVSLLPDMLIAVFYTDQLVARMGEALAPVSEGLGRNGEVPSSINLITGPSRSADIENDLTIGVHGPGKVYAVMIRRGK
jgi:L-lactate dehydrogenase complex protein LldG